MLVSYGSFVAPVAINVSCVVIEVALRVEAISAEAVAVAVMLFVLLLVVAPFMVKAKGIAEKVVVVEMVNAMHEASGDVCYL